MIFLSDCASASVCAQRKTSLGSVYWGRHLSWPKLPVCSVHSVLFLSFVSHLALFVRCGSLRVTVCFVRKCALCAFAWMAFAPLGQDSLFVGLLAL